MPAPYHHLRLMADDMTGALDSAAGFVGLFGPLAVGAKADSSCPVLDTATRERPETEAAQRVATLAGHLAPEPGRLSFFKVDSLLRGHAGAEMASVLAKHRFDHTIIAPALPFQRRLTREGRQWVQGADGLAPTGEDIAASLRRAGFAVRLAPNAEAPQHGITVFDAATDADLDRIVTTGLARDGNTLWVGSGGLAAALGRALGGGAPPRPALPAPLLGLIGTDHPVMKQQLVPFADRLVALADRPDNEFMPASDGQPVFAVPALPAGLCRSAAQAMIAGVFADFVRKAPRPGSLFVSGGETLRNLMLPLGVDRLMVLGEWEPGLPVSQLVGGRWDGLTVISKSGAFGTPDLLARLTRALQPSDRNLAS